MIKYNHRAGAWYQNELYFSPAYQSLTNSARNLFHCMYNELKWKGAGQKREFTNNGEISLTEIQFKKMYNCCSSTYLTARNQLIEVGLIKYWRLHTCLLKNSGGSSIQSAIGNLKFQSPKE
jgi:hypothetical protein